MVCIKDFITSPRYIIIRIFVKARARSVGEKFHQVQVKNLGDTCIHIFLSCVTLVFFNARRSRSFLPPRGLNLADYFVWGNTPLTDGYSENERINFRASALGLGVLLISPSSSSSPRVRAHTSMYIFFIKKSSCV